MPTQASAVRPYTITAVALLAVATAGFAWLSLLAWNGRLGWLAMALLLVSGTALAMGRRQLSSDARKPVDLLAKMLFTVIGLVALLRHPIPVGDGRSLPIYSAILDYVDQVDTQTFVIFA